MLCAHPPRKPRSPAEGSLDADAAGRGVLTFQVFPVSGCKRYHKNQEQEYTDLFQDYVIGGFEASERIIWNNSIYFQCNVEHLALVTKWVKSMAWLYL